MRPTIIIATAIPIPSPAFAPVPMSLFKMRVEIGVAVVTSMRLYRIGVKAILLRSEAIAVGEGPARVPSCELASGRGGLICCVSESRSDSVVSGWAW